MILLQSPDGREKCLVESAEGYDGWSVVAKGVSKPKPGCYWCENGKGWKPLDVRMIDRVRNPAELAKIIEELQAQVAALQPK
jgi:hypothetical protein